MTEQVTKYGLLKGISSIDYYDTGIIKECIVDQYNEITTPYGKLVPQYEQDNVRRKYTKSLSFYKNGNLKSVNLQEQTTIQTKYGDISAELITFYEDESIKRIFPLNGKLTGYWSEENEYTLSESLTFNFEFGKINNKIIGIAFYPTNQIKSITLWQNEKAILNTPCGEVNTRIGFSLYEDGSLKACEPVLPTRLSTPIGDIFAYDITAVGIHADNTSLSFNNGNLKSLTTSTDGIKITTPDNHIHYFKPELTPSLMDPNAMDTVPLQLNFENNIVRIQNNPELIFNINDCTFEIDTFVHQPFNKCQSCSSCSGCS